MDQELRKNQHTVFNYSDVFFSYHFSYEQRCNMMARDHYLVYVYSGEYIIEEEGVETTLHAGDCVFLRRDNRIKMIKQNLGEEPFQGIFMKFKRPFLRELFQKFDKREIPLDVAKHKTSVVVLPRTPDLTGLFQSLQPYFNTTIVPNERMMDLKLLEGVQSLLNIDRRFFATLFDFTEPWKIDILDFMNANYMYDLSIEEIASFTGRSLSTFKRDFAKISDISPQKWLTQKRLQAAYGMLKDEGKKVSDVYFEVGFKNLSHFSSAFKKQYGVAPSSYS